MWKTWNKSDINTECVCVNSLVFIFFCFLRTGFAYIKNSIQKINLEIAILKEAML